MLNYAELWHHWIDTTRSLDRRGSRMLFPKRWPITGHFHLHVDIDGSTDLAHQGHLDMSSTCNSAMAPWPWTVAMASLGRHHEVSRPAWGSHVVPQTVAIATCMSTSMGVRIWHIEGNAASSVPQPYALLCTATRPHRHIAPGAAGGRYTNSVRAQALRLKPRPRPAMRMRVTCLRWPQLASLSASPACPTPR